VESEIAYCGDIIAFWCDYQLPFGQPYLLILLAVESTFSV